MCDRVAIVARGRCIASGRVAELLQGTKARFRVRADDPRAPGVLTSAGWTVEPDGDGSFLVDVDASRSHDVTSALAAAGIYLSELSPVSRSLEDVFLELTEDAQ